MPVAARPGRGVRRPSELQQAATPDAGRRRAPKARPSRRRPRRSAREHDEVVAVDDLVRARRAAGRRCAARPPRAASSASTAASPGRTPRPSGPGHLDRRRRRRTSPSTRRARRPAAATRRARRAPGGRRRRRRPCRDAAGEGDPQLAGRQPAVVGPERRCRRPARRPTASASTSGRRRSAITARTPDHDAIRAAASFDAMPPLPRVRARAAGARLEHRVVGRDLLDERAPRDRRGDRR